jgi:pentatricopeptide repeat protein
LEQAQQMQHQSSSPIQLDGLAIISSLHACAELGKTSEALYYLQLLKDLQQQQQPNNKNVHHRHHHPTNNNVNKNDTVIMGLTPLLGPDAVAYHVAISTCARGGAWQDGIRLLEECRRSCSSSSTTTTTTSSSSAPAAAANVVAYTAAITGCEYAGQLKHAFALLDQMRRQDQVQPNQIIMCAVLGELIQIYNAAIRPCAEARQSRCGLCLDGENYPYRKI